MFFFLTFFGFLGAAGAQLDGLSALGSGGGGLGALGSLGQGAGALSSLTSLTGGSSPFGGLNSFVANGGIKGPTEPCLQKVSTVFGTNVPPMFTSALVSQLTDPIRKRLNSCRNQVTCTQEALTSVVGQKLGQSGAGGMGSLLSGGSNLLGGGLPFGRQKRQFDSLLGGAGGASPFGSLGSIGGSPSPSPSSGNFQSTGNSLADIQKIARCECERAAEKQLCTDIENQLNDPNCNLCDVISLSQKSDSIKKCACDNMDLTQGFNAATLTQPNGPLVKCAANQVAGKLVKDQMSSMLASSLCPSDGSSTSGNSMAGLESGASLLGGSSPGGSPLEGSPLVGSPLGGSSPGGIPLGGSSFGGGNPLTAFGV